MALGRQKEGVGKEISSWSVIHVLIIGGSVDDNVLMQVKAIECLPTNMSYHKSWATLP